MSATAPDPPVDLTSTEDDPADSAATSKGHRGLDDIWDHYKKIKLEKGEASRLHRNYDARCKGCNTHVPGKPEKLRRHLATCNKAAPHSQIHVSESHCSVDLDFNHPAWDVSATTAPVSAGVLARTQLGDSNEDFDLNDMISRA